MKEYNFFKLQGDVRPASEQLLDTKLFYQKRSRNDGELVGAEIIAILAEINAL